MSNARFITWVSTNTNKKGFGVTPGDSFYQGNASYDSAFPCPNGLGFSTHTNANCLVWRRRIEKARKDAEEHAIHIDWIDSLTEAHQLWASDDVARLKALSESLYE